MITKQVWLTGEVDSDMLRKVYRTLREARGKAVHFLLNSSGGTEPDGLAICDLFSRYKGRITVEVLGVAESMAAVILQAADVRLISPNSYLMLHQGETTAEGHKKNIRAYLKIGDMQDDACDQLVLTRIRKKYPKYSWAKFREESNFDLYFSAERALQWGLVNKIVK